jgi:hypothetical protein
VYLGVGISVFNLAEYEDIKPRDVLDTYARSKKGATLGQEDHHDCRTR